jgi:hypothetical protein
VITKLGGSDKHYALIKLPLTIPLENVEAVDRLETNNSGTAFTVGGLLLVAGLIVFLATFRVEIY